MSKPARKASPSAAHRLELVGELASLINSTFDLDEIFQEAILKLRGVMEFRRASVALVTDDRASYYLHTLYDAAREGFIERSGSYPIGAGLTGKAINTGTPIRVDDFHGTEGIRLKGERRVSILIIPLRVDGEVIGTLNLGAEATAPYGDDDLELAVLLGRQIETSLHYSKLLATIEQQRSRLEAEHAQVQSERSRLVALIDASEAAVLMVSHGRVAHTNRGFARLIGRPREVLLGSPIEPVHEALAGAFADPAMLTPQVAALAGGEALHDRVQFTFPERVICERTVAPVLDRTDRVLGHVLIYRDVTREAEAAAAKDEFVSIVSHELRTPLTSIKTSLDLLSRGAAGELPAAMADLADIALRNLDRLIRLVDDLLDLSRIQSGRVVTELHPVSATEAAARAHEAVRAFAEDRGVRLETTFRQRPITVMGDADRLEQVFVNLLANAVKFSPRGTRVCLSGWIDGDSALFEVTDEGPGIPADQLETIFERFRQLETATTRSHGGAGLGLAISRGIVQHVGGRLWAESEEGAGSRFYVRLPLAAAEQEGKQA